MSDATTEPPRVEHVVIAGASGGTGRRLLDLLTPREVTVRATTRSEQTARELREAGADEVAIADLMDPDAARRAVEGADAVLSAVGSTPGQVLRAQTFVDGRGNRNLVAAAAETGVEAVVMESAIGVGDEPASPLATAFDLFIGPVQQAKADAEATLRAADVQHTIVRPGVLTAAAAPCSVQIADAGARLWGAVSRRSVARVMAAALATPALGDRTVEVVANPLLADRAIDLELRLPNG